MPKDKFDDFDEKMAGFRRQESGENTLPGMQTPETQDQINKNMHIGRRAGGIFVSHVMAGGVLGFVLDRFLHTAPLFMLGLLFVGFGYGLYRCKKITEGTVK